LLAYSGIGEGRLRLDWVSSAEAQRFADVASQVVEDVKRAGPLDRKRYTLELEALRMTLDSEFVRWTVGKEKPITDQGDVYGRSWDPEKFGAALGAIATKEFDKNLICAAFAEGCLTLRDVARMSGLELHRVSYLLTDLEKSGRVQLTEMKEHTPHYAITL